MFFKDSFLSRFAILISWTSKVMYRHEIIFTGNKAYLINNYLFFGTMQWLPHSGKSVNKANSKPKANQVHVRGMRASSSLLPDELRAGCKIRGRLHGIMRQSQYKNLYYISFILYTGGDARIVANQSCRLHRLPSTSSVYTGCTNLVMKRTLQPVD